MTNADIVINGLIAVGQVAPTLTITDATDYAGLGIEPSLISVLVRVTDPDGTLYENVGWDTDDYTTVDIDPSVSTSMAPMAIAHDSNTPHIGSYTIEFKIKQLVGGGDPLYFTSDEAFTWDSSLPVPDLAMDVNYGRSQIFTYDRTEYEMSFDSVAATPAIVRLHTVTKPSDAGCADPGATSDQDRVIGPNIWSSSALGDWEGELDVVATYSPTGWLSVVYSFVEQASLDVEWYNISTVYFTGTKNLNDALLAYREEGNVFQQEHLEGALQDINTNFHLYWQASRMREPTQEFLDNIADILNDNGQFVPEVHDSVEIIPIYGYLVELTVADGEIKWRYSGGGDWQTLIELTEITGAAGPQGIQGIDGPAIEVQVDGGMLQYRVVGDLVWLDLYEFPDATVYTEMSVTGDGSTGDKVKLVGDEETPNPLSAYMTDVLGDKGWSELPAIIQELWLNAYLIKHDWTGTLTANEFLDSDDGFAVGSTVLDTAGLYWKCQEATVGNAVWDQISNDTALSVLWVIVGGLLKPFITNTPVYVESNHVNGALRGKSVNYRGTEGVSVTGPGSFGQSTSGAGGYHKSESGPGDYGESKTGAGGSFNRKGATNNDVLTGLVVSRESVASEVDVPPVAGVGVRFEMNIDNEVNEIRPAVAWEAVYSDVSEDHENAELYLKAQKDGAYVDRQYIDEDGVFHHYGGSKIGNIAGGHYLEILPSGTVVLHGDARYWRSEIASAESLPIKTSASKIVLDDDNCDVYFTDSATTADYAWKNIPLNNDRVLQQIIYLHVYWIQQQAATPNFMVQYRYQYNLTGETSAWTDAIWEANIGTYPGSGDYNQITRLASITPEVGDVVNAILQVRFIRDTNNGSTLFTDADAVVGDVHFRSLNVHVLCDELGSDNEFSKSS